MKRLHYTRTNNLSKLHDELLAAIPALRPIPNDDGKLVVVMRVEGRGDDIWLTVPDDADETAIAAVVDAHDPTPRPVPPTVEERLAAAEDAILFITLREMM